MTWKVIAGVFLAAHLASAHAQNFSAEDLARRSVERRAVEAVIWGMPAVNYERMLQATIDNGAKPNQVVYWSRPVESGGVGKFSHRREVASIDNQTVIRLNRDTLYSAAVFDLDAGAVTVTLPDAGERFMSLMAVNQDHYVPVVIYRDSHTFTRKEMARATSPRPSARWWIRTIRKT